MGLDIEIRKVWKPDVVEGKIYDGADLYGITILEEDKGDPRVSQLMPYMAKAKIRNDHYDIDKIKKDYGLHEGSYVYRLSIDGIGVFDPVTRDTVGIPHSVVQEKYIIYQVEDSFLCEYESIRTFRKNYKIQDWFHERLGNVENTGMYMLTEDIIAEFNKEFPDYAIQESEIDPERPLFYWEWY